MIRILWALNAVWDIACVLIMIMSEGHGSPHASMWRDMAVFEARRPLAIACVGGWGTLRALGSLDPSHWGMIARIIYLFEAFIGFIIIRELETLKAVAVIGMSLGLGSFG